MSDAPTIFDKILAGEIPCHRVYEDEHVLAFLDIGPLSHGHTLVIPKEAKPFLHQLSDASSAAMRLYWSSIDSGVAPPDSSTSSAQNPLRAHVSAIDHPFLTVSLCEPAGQSACIKHSW